MKLLFEYYRRMWLFLLLTSLLVFTGCGYYSLKGSLPAHIQTLSITPVLNESGEFGISETLGNTLIDRFIAENVLDLTRADQADSQLDVVVKSVTDKPYTYSLSESTSYEQVDDWRLTIRAQVVWYDITQDEAFFDKEFTSYAVYGQGVDITTDGRDNDDDGLIDSADDDEFGSPREFALKVAVNKIIDEIINEVTSTW